MSFLSQLDWSDALGTVLVFLAGLAAAYKWFQDRQRAFELGVRVVYGAVSEISRKTETDIDDKVALALGKLAEYLGRPLSGQESVRAKSTFDALHFEEKKAEAVASPT